MLAGGFRISGSKLTVVFHNSCSWIRSVQVKIAAQLLKPVASRYNVALEANPRLRAMKPIRTYITGYSGIIMPSNYYLLSI